MQRPHHCDALLRELHNQEIYEDTIATITSPIDPKSLDAEEGYTTLISFATRHQVPKTTARILAKFITSYLTRTRGLNESFERWAGVENASNLGFDPETYLKGLASLHRWLKNDRFSDFEGALDELVENRQLKETIEGKFMQKRLRLINIWMKAMVKIDVGSFRDVKTVNVGTLGTRHALLQVLQIAEGYMRRVTELRRMTRQERQNLALGQEVRDASTIATLTDVGLLGDIISMDLFNHREFPERASLGLRRLSQLARRPHINPFRSLDDEDEDNDFAPNAVLGAERSIGEAITSRTPALTTLQTLFTTADREIPIDTELGLRIPSGSEAGFRLSRSRQRRGTMSDEVPEESRWS